MLSVMFNTTVHDDNLDEVPDLVRFFKANAGRVRTASFHALAATGRGVHEKKRAITLDMITAQIELGAGTRVNFRSSLAGHPQCNRYGLCLAVNGRLYDALDKPGFIARMPTLIAYINLYASVQVPGDYQTEFIDYDWTVNDQHRDQSGSRGRGLFAAAD